MNTGDIRIELSGGLFEHQETNSKKEIAEDKKISKIALSPGDEIRFKDGTRIVLKEPFSKIFNNSISITQIIKKNESIPKFIPYIRKFPYASSRATLKKEISASQIIDNLAQQIGDYNNRKGSEIFFDKDQMQKMSQRFKELPEPRKRSKFFRDELLAAHRERRVARRKLDQALKEILIKNTEGIISDRMAWFYVANILVAAGIESDPVKQVSAALQAKYRYQKKTSS
jgi:hypothetical protein